MQRRERGRRLSHLPKLEPASDIARGKEPERNQSRQVPVRLCKETEIALPPDQLLEIADHLRKAVVQPISFMAFATVNENRFDVVAHVYQSEPEIRLEPFLIVVETDQAPPDDGRAIRT